MKKFNDYLAEMNRPGGSISDRSLEGFRTILNQLQMQTKSVLDPNAKQELQLLINQFHQQIRQVLLKYKEQGVGYRSKNFDLDATDYR